MKFRKALLGSPYYPTLYSLYNALHYVNSPLQIQRLSIETLQKESSCFLVHINISSREIITIARWNKTKDKISLFSLSKNKWANMELNHFKRIWNGVAITQPQNTTHVSHISYSLILIILFFLTIGLTAILSHSSHFWLLMPIMIGLTLSIWPIHQIYYKYTDFHNLLCNSISYSNCNEVMTSKYGSIFGMSLLGASASFFSSQLIVCLLSSPQSLPISVHSIYLFSTIILIPLSLYSLTTQIKQKTVCPICIIILGCLASEVALYIINIPQTISLPIILKWSVIEVACLLLFEQIIKQRKKSIRLENEVINLSRLKRNKQVVKAISSPLKIDSPCKELMIHSKRNGSKPKLTVFLSPSCSHCKKMMLDLLELQETGKIHFDLNIILGESRKEDRIIIYNIIRSHILSPDKLRFLIKEDFYKISQEKIDESSLISEKISDYIEYFKNVIINNKIQSYPRLAIDGLLLPDFYTAEDMELWLLDNLNQSDNK